MMENGQTKLREKNSRERRKAGVSLWYRLSGVTSNILCRFLTSSMLATC